MHRDPAATAHPHLDPAAGLNPEPGPGPDLHRGPSDLPDSAVDAVLDRQAGVITRGQAVAAGLSPAAIDERLRLRRWRPLHPRVYLARGRRPGAEAGMRAAMLWAGPTAVLSGTSAAWWHGLIALPPATVTVTVGRVARRRCRPRAGLAVRCHDLAAVDVTVESGLRVAALPLAVLDGAVGLGPAGPALLDRALRERVRFPAVRAAHARMHGTPGAARAALLLDAAADRSAAAAAALLARLLLGSGMTGWRVELPREAPPDPAGSPAPRIGFPGAGLWIELRGWAWSRQPAPGRPDPVGGPARKVLKYTWHDLVDRPSIVLAEIAGAVADRQREASAVISATCVRTAGHLGEQARLAPGYPEM